jgi:hypothetical protein
MNVAARRSLSDVSGRLCITGKDHHTIISKAPTVFCRITLSYLIYHAYKRSPDPRRVF